MISFVGTRPEIKRRAFCAIAPRVIPIEFVVAHTEQGSGIQTTHDFARQRVIAVVESGRFRRSFEQIKQR